MSFLFVFGALVVSIWYDLSSYRVFALVVEKILPRWQGNVFWRTLLNLGKIEQVVFEVFP